MKNQKHYRAFTLLEILISIIILGIVMTSFPIIFQSMTNANKEVLKEEVFFREFAVLSLINSMYFDENNTLGDNFYKDLNATQGDSELLNTVFSTYAGGNSRIGKTAFNNNILRSGSGDTVSSIGRDAPTETLSDTSTLNDIDDFNEYNETLNYITVNGNHPVIYVNVKYIDDNATYSDQNITDFDFNYSSSPAVSNIKLITVRCEMGDTNITLRYPTSNIGASKFLSLEEISR